MKWAAIQPLTGGMYLGAEEAIGNPAEFILTYKGLDIINKDKDDNITGVGNEAYLLEYLKKVNREVPYYKINREMFDSNIYDLNPEITLNGEISEPNYADLDIVVAVPVCSGLSMATSAKQDTKDGRNCNMLYLANLALRKIKPKIYIFENAPTFMGSRGDELRIQFEELARDTEYSITYYKTDTCLHNNCQKRPRTFIIFSKTEGAIKMNWEKTEINVLDYLNNYPKSEFNNDIVPTNPRNHKLLEFIKKEYGENWRDIVKGNLMDFLGREKKLDELKEFFKDDKKSVDYVDHIIYKKSLGLNYYSSDYVIQNDKISAVQFRSMPMLLHPLEDRTYTIREYLNFMGHPSDFEWFGNESNLPKIGQNVPVKTAKFIVNECIEALNGNREFFDSKVVYLDNIKQKTQKIA